MTDEKAIKLNKLANTLLDSSLTESRIAQMLCEYEGIRPVDFIQVVLWEVGIRWDCEKEGFILMFADGSMFYCGESI